MAVMALLDQFGEGLLSVFARYELKRNAHGIELHAFDTHNK